MNEIEKVKENFDEYVKNNIDALVNIGSGVANFIKSYLVGFDKMSSKFFADKIEIIIKFIDNINSNGAFEEKYKIIYQQAIVLLVSRFESFMNELAAFILDNYPEKFDWDKKDKISIEPSYLNFYSKNISSLIIKSLKGINFQDLQSTERFLEDYLSIKLNIDNIKDEIILAQAYRNIIVHNGFVAQILFRV